VSSLRHAIELSQMLTERPSDSNGLSSFFPITFCGDYLAESELSSHMRRLFGRIQFRQSLADFICPRGSGL